MGVTMTKKKEMMGECSVLILQDNLILHDGNMIGYYYDKKEGDDRLMQCAHTASQPLILHDEHFIGYYHDKKEGDD
eukprot:14158277-Ditylum_brightwellii.AAC.1